MGMGPEYALNLCDVLGSTQLSARRHPVNEAAVDAPLSADGPTGGAPGRGAYAAAFEKLDAIASRALERLGAPGFSRVYVGSYFCERFFLHLTDVFFDAVASWADAYGMGMTLVVPVFGQATVESGMARVEKLPERSASPSNSHREGRAHDLKDGTQPDAVHGRPTEGCAPLETVVADGASASAEPDGRFSEVVVNDPAMAQFVRTLLDAPIGGMARQPKLVRGRLMMKANRDPRYAQLAETPQPLPYDARMAERDRLAWRPALVECDPFAPVVDASALDDAAPLALHLPHAMMSTGRICLAASRHLDEREKFRPGRACARECLDGVDVHEGRNFDDGTTVYLARQGRTVFFENPMCRVVGTDVARVIWTPADFLCPVVEDGGAS